MKVFMMTDLEGAAGVVSFGEQTYPDGRYHDNAKKLLTAEINAAVDGMLEAGVDDVLVFDGHGPGGVWFEDLHPKAKLLHGRPVAPRSIVDAATADYDVCMIVGQHAMAGVVTSNLNHTQSSKQIDYYKLNGQPIGEIAQFAYYQGACGQPMIFLSGERDACQEAEALVPGIVTAETKQGLGRQCAISLSATAARQVVRDGAKRAIEAHRKNPIDPLTVEPPYAVEVRYFHTEDADAQMRRPEVERVDSQTIRVRHDSDIRKVIYA